jgi:hypothetical protein
MFGLGAFLAKSALMQSPIGKVLGKVPSRVWKILAIVVISGLLIFFALRWHSNKVETFGNEKFQAGYDSRDAEIKKLQTQLNQRNAELATALRSKTDEKLRDVARDADIIRLHGPGKAACTSVGGLPTSPGGHDQTRTSPGTSLPEVRDGEWDELIALPFSETVTVFENHDSLRIEVLGWREYHRVFTEEWKKYKEAADKTAQIK